jgi:catechol 2,3-dioxygenase-like lactoylglutathione lyase family enzyme
MASPWEDNFLIMDIKSLHHVAYRCKDAKQTAEFYTKVLGLEYAMAMAEDRAGVVVVVRDVFPDDRLPVVRAVAGDDATFAVPRSHPVDPYVLVGEQRCGSPRLAARALGALSGRTDRRG